MRCTAHAAPSLHACAVGLQADAWIRERRTASSCRWLAIRRTRSTRPRDAGSAPDVRSPNGYAQPRCPRWERCLRCTASRASPSSPAPAIAWLLHDWVRRLRARLDRPAATTWRSRWCGERSQPRPCDGRGADRNRRERSRKVSVAAGPPRHIACIGAGRRFDQHLRPRYRRDVSGGQSTNARRRGLYDLSRAHDRV